MYTFPLLTCIEIMFEVLGNDDIYHLSLSFSFFLSLFLLHICCVFDLTSIFSFLFFFFRLTNASPMVSRCFLL